MSKIPSVGPGRRSLARRLVLPLAVAGVVLGTFIVLLMAPPPGQPGPSSLRAVSGVDPTGPRPSQAVPAPRRSGSPTTTGPAATATTADAPTVTDTTATTPSPRSTETSPASPRSSPTRTTSAQAPGPPASPRPTMAPSPAPQGSPAPAWRVPSRSVGYRGDPGALRVIDSPGAAPPGSTWTGGILQVNTDNLTLDRVYVRGGVEFNGRGTLKITNSIVEGGGAWMVVTGNREGCRLDVRDSTLRWRAGATPPQGIGAGAIHGACMITAMRNDISGTPDGIQAGDGDTLIEGNWIHDLALLGTEGNNTHNDGIQLYWGSGIVIRDNWIEIGWDGLHQNGAVFFQGSFDGPVIEGNYLSGGGYTLRIERGARGAVVRNNTIVRAADAWGEALLDDGTVAIWSGNVDGSGAPLPAG